MWQPLCPHARPRAKGARPLPSRSSQPKPLSSPHFQARLESGRTTFLPGALSPVPMRSGSHAPFLRSPEKEVGRRASASENRQSGTTGLLGPDGAALVLPVHLADKMPSSQRWQTQLGIGKQRVPGSPAFYFHFGRAMRHAGS